MSSRSSLVDRVSLVWSIASISSLKRCAVGPALIGAALIALAAPDASAAGPIVIMDEPRAGPSIDARPAWSEPGPRPVRGVHASVDPVGLRALLAGAPVARRDAHLSDYGLLIDLPHPSGDMVPCFVAASPVMEPELAAKFPMMRTYVAQSIDGLATGRIELTQRGLTGMLREPADASGAATGAGGTWMIDTWNSGDPTRVVSYWLRDLAGSNDWTCHTVVDAAQDAKEDEPWNEGSRALQTLRTARLAMACTGEYGVHHSTLQGNPPNVADPLAAIVTVVSRTNVVYEADLAVHFDLVADNDQIVFIDPGADPYPDTCDGLGGSDCSSPILGANTDAINNQIGSSAYDVGHCITRVAGGVASLRSPCGNSKARGVSGIPRGGDADPLSALVVIHELGHQFGANHTFSGTRGRCGNNANLPTAWEAGTGSSPMGYAGGCPVGDAPPSDNIVQFADPYFHHGSVGEMRSFLADEDADCMPATGTANNIPEITFRTPDIEIPPGTPFTLTAAATDADGETLVYSWEQRDSGVRRPLSGDGSEDTGNGALFRIFPPVLDGTRTFPQWSDILSGVPTPGEQLPSVTDATRDFRVYVRDNHPGSGGSVISSTVDLFIPPGTSPFGVVAPSEGTVLAPGSASVSWTVGNTDMAPISCATVTILLSTDDGATWPHTLGTFANSGSASVALPSVGSSEARVRINANGEIFFAVSRPFVIVACAADYSQNGEVDVLDFLDFIDDFGACENQPSPCGGLGDPDLNGDTIVDILDFLDFLDAFGNGC
jgi:hypothetical protein